MSRNDWELSLYDGLSHTDSHNLLLLLVCLPCPESRFSYVEYCGSISLWVLLSTKQSLDVNLAPVNGLSAHLSSVQRQWRDQLPCSISK